MSELINKNPTLFWGLVSSVIVVLIIGFSVFFILRHKTLKIREKIARMEKTTLEKRVDRSNANPILNRPDMGELLWDEKEVLIKKNKYFMDDLSLEYSINTVFRNAYSEILVVSDEAEYELLTFIKKTEATKFYYSNDENVIKKFIEKNKIKKEVNTYKGEAVDFCLIHGNKKQLSDIFESVYKNLNDNGIIIIENLKNRKTKREINDLLKYLKLVGYRFEKKNWENGLIIVAK
ncbi:MAG: hypothetical protein NC236_01635 [Mycoplasma sp.]|nr:hypothetical protein [Mycoplasma sp.]